MLHPHECRASRRHFTHPRGPRDSQEQLWLKTYWILNLLGPELSISIFLILREAPMFSNKLYNVLKIKLILILFI